MDQIEINRMIASAIDIAYDYYKADVIRFTKAYPNEINIKAKERLKNHI